MTDKVQTRLTVERRNLIVSAMLYLLAYFSLFFFEAYLGISPLGESGNNSFVYQAYSFLHGHLDLASVPGISYYDSVMAHGSHYLVYPPMPALLLLPFVAISGLHTSDILFTALVSALDLPLLYLLFERISQLGLARRAWRTNLLLAVVLYFGSISLWLSLGGNVWFTEQIVAFCFTLLSLLLAFHRRWLWSAICLACAFLTRGTLALGFPFLLLLAWYDVDPAGWPRFSRATLTSWRPARSWRIDWQDVRVRRVVAVAGVLTASIALFLVRDDLYFGSPFETGYGLTLAQNYPSVQYGVYSWHYLWMNFVANFLDLPHIAFVSSTDLHPTVDLVNGGMGISVFVTTPLFLLLFLRNARFSPLRAALWATVALVVVQVLFYDWTGYYQFGARYLFDAYPYAFLLLVLDEMRIDWRVILLGLLGIVINVAGAIQYWR